MISRDRVSCRSSVLCALAASLMLVAVPAWIRATPPGEQSEQMSTAEVVKYAGIDEAMLDGAIEAEFTRDPEVKALLKEIEEKRKELERVNNLARAKADPALKFHQKLMIALEKRYKQLWEEKYDSIRKKVIVGMKKGREPVLDEAIEAEFTRDPEVRALFDAIETKQKELDRVAMLPRRAEDPVLKWHKKEILALEKQYGRLWEEKYDSIRKKAIVGMKKDRGGRLREIESTLQRLLEQVKELREEDDQE